MKSIHDHVDPEDKKILSELVSKTKQNELFPLKNGPLKRNEGYKGGPKLGHPLRTLRTSKKSDFH